MGERVDVGMDRQIKDLDNKLRILNFGVKIDHGTFDDNVPDGVTRTNDIEVYRDWKQSAIFLKMA